MFYVYAGLFLKLILSDLYLLKKSSRITNLSLCAEESFFYLPAPQKYGMSFLPLYFTNYHSSTWDNYSHNNKLDFQTK